jgi:hypothetical protein
MLTTETTPQKPDCCAVALLGGATAQQPPFSSATGRATGAQRISLKALASKHLKRNNPRNEGATVGQKAVQQTGEKTGHFVAHRCAPVALDLRAKLHEAATRVCREIHGDDDQAVEQMLDDLKHTPNSDWVALIDHFERQLPPPPEPGYRRITVKAAGYQFDVDMPEEKAQVFLEEDDFDRLTARGPAPVCCADCDHATVTNGIASCGAGEDSGLATGGRWATDRHQCGNFEGRL